MVQEYGRYFGMNTGVSRGDVWLDLHTLELSYMVSSLLAKCVMTDKPYIGLMQG